MSLERAMQSFRDDRSMEMYGKYESQLTIAEVQKLNEYIKDYINPIWKPVYINGVNTGYEVSTLGQIKNRKGVVSTYDIVKYRDDKRYVPLAIKIKGESVRKDVHRVVAETFIPNPLNKREVNHINGNKHFNWVGNLEWVTRQENADHAVANGLMRVGENGQSATHTEEEAHQVCKLAEQGLGHKKIAEQLNVDDHFVIGIMYRGEWRHVSKNYKMPEVKKYADKEVIHNICKKLSSGMRPYEIAKQLNVDLQLCMTVKNGTAWRYISNQYDIPGLEKVEVREKTSDKIRALLDEGVTDTYDILNKLQLEPTKANKKNVQKIRLKYKRKKLQEETN